MRPKLRPFPARLMPYGTVLALVLLAATGPAGAGPATAAATPAVRHVLGDPQELEAFVDGVLAAQLDEQHIAGAVVVVVQDGKVLLAKGYGFADVEKGIPVDAERTLFRPGSVSKLFTWTAVMQLVEQGEIDLDADINAYLTGIQLPATYPQPITMLDLMAHVPGFEDRSDNLFKSTPEELTSLEDYLGETMPARVYAPGTVPAYSNYGTALAGYIVEQVAGEPYEQYVEEHIFQPLGMEHSSFRQPLPAELAPGMSQGYRFDGQFGAAPFELCQAGPAGALSATGSDMARFMLAHLQDGSYDGGRILSPETARLMQTQSYTFDPALPGMAHGFMESQVNGRRLIGHGGDTVLFHSVLQLLPEEQVGLFVSYNTAGGSHAPADLLQAFMDRYFPADSTSAPQPPPDFADRVDDYTGDYLMSRMSHTTPEKILALFSMLPIRPGPDDSLRIPNPLDPARTDSWVEVRPLVVQNTRTGEQVVFHEDEQGEARYAALSSVPVIILIKQPWYGGQAFQAGVIGFSLLTFLLTVIAAVVALFLPRPATEGVGAPRRPGRLARWVALALCAAAIAFVAAFLMFAQNATTDVAALNHPPALLRALPWVTAALAAAVLVLMVAGWRQRWWGRAGRVHYTVVALAGVAFVGFAAYWRLLGF